MRKQELADALAAFDDHVVVTAHCRHCQALTPLDEVAGSNMTGLILHASGQRPPDQLLSLPDERAIPPG